MSKQNAIKKKGENRLHIVKDMDQSRNLGSKKGEVQVSWREMHDSYGFMLRPFFKKFFLPIRFSSIQEKQLQETARSGHIVFVMESSSILHYLFLNFWCSRLRLPLAAYGNGIPSFFLFQSIEKIFHLFRKKLLSLRSKEREGISESFSLFCERRLREGRSMVLFLHRYRRFRKKSYNEAKEFLDVLAGCQDRCQQPLFLVPVSIIWGKRPDKVKKSIFDILLGDNDARGLIRQSLVLFRCYRHSVVSMGPVIDLKAFRQANDHLERELFLKKIRWSLHRELALAKKQVTGPSIKPRRHMLESVLSSRSLRELAREISRAEGKPFETVMKKAAKYADEIAADYSINYIEFLEWLLRWVWNNIYSGFYIDKEGLERVREAARKSSIILLPSHKSHLDYLVLSCIFYNNDLPPPHIVAGVNLSFWPLGHIFRRSGAFFLRRTIRGQKLYSAVFSTYLRKLMREGYVQEFFIEGTRSRTGKLLQPKLGVLSMEIDAFAQGVSEDLHLVPLSITYEKVVEEASYTKELGGDKKKKEGFWELLKTPRFLKKKYGRVYIQFAPPLSVREYLQAKQIDLTGLDATRRGGIVEDLAGRACFAIDEVTTVTPSALAATVLLNHHKRGIPLSDLTKRASYLLHLLQDSGARRSLSLQNLPWAIEEVLNMFVGDKIIQQWDEPEGPLYTLDDAKRIHLDYYKNNILHFFLPFSLVASVFQLHRTDNLSETRILDGLRYFMDLFAREFIFPPEDSVRSFWRIVRYHFVVKRGYLSIDEQGEIRIQDPSPIEYFAGFIRNYFESYYVFFCAVEQILDAGDCEEKEFFSKMLDLGDSLYRRGDLSCSESRSTFIFRNAFNCMLSQGCIRRTKSKNTVSLVLDGAGKRKMRDYQQTLARLLFSRQSPELH